MAGDPLNLPQIDGIDQSAKPYERGQGKVALSKMGKMSFEEGSKISNSVGYFTTKKKRMEERESKMQEKVKM